MAGVTMVIKGPRQCGKSRLLDLVARSAGQVGKRVARLDFQYLDAAALRGGEPLFRQFCEMIAAALGIEGRTSEFFKGELSNSQKCEKYVRDYVLKAVQGEVCLAIDEVDRVVDPQGGERDPNSRASCADLLRMLRIWHNKRNPEEDVVWNRLDLVLVTSTEPYLLIPDNTSSPFNVAQRFEHTPPEFSPDEVDELNLEYEYPLKDTARLYTLLRGHPGLTQEAFFSVRAKRFTEERLHEEAAADNGPFSLVSGTGVFNSR